MPAHQALDRSDLCAHERFYKPHWRDEMSFPSLHPAWKKGPTPYLNPLSLHKPYSFHLVSMAGDVRSLRDSEQRV